jgi:hypothetical protein
MSRCSRSERDSTCVRYFVRRGGKVFGDNIVSRVLCLLYVSFTPQREKLRQACVMNTYFKVLLTSIVTVVEST